jgi:hypothetical protein
VFVPTVLYFYFENPQSITSNLTLQKYFDEYDAQWERLEFLGAQNLTELQGKAAMTFLRTAQWDLIACREGREPAPEEKKKRLEKQYQDALSIAKRLHVIDFLEHYDYYVLAYPNATLILRLWRQVCLRMRKVWNHDSTQ